MLNLLNCKKEEFATITKDKKIICFGSGIGLEDVFKVYPFVVEKVECIVDNYKFGQIFECAETKIPVVSVSDIKELNKDVICLITTYKYAKEIVEQLDQISIFDNAITYMPFVFIDSMNYEIELKKNTDIKIPKKIHYCWFGNSEMPEQFKKNIETWKRYCPDYEIVCWNESNYDISKCKYMEEAYENKKWGFVPDYARLDIINTYGGIYLDTDVELLKPFDDFLGYDLFCGFESDRYVAFGLGFGGKANNPILKEMMEQYERLSFVKEDGSLNLIASPVFQTEILEKHGLRSDGSYQEVAGATVFPKEVFAPFNTLGVGMITQNTYSIHQYAATWFDEIMKGDKKKTLESTKYILSRINN